MTECWKQNAICEKNNGFLSFRGLKNCVILNNEIIQPAIFVKAIGVYASPDSTWNTQIGEEFRKTSK